MELIDTILTKRFQIINVRLSRAQIYHLHLTLQLLADSFTLGLAAPENNLQRSFRCCRCNDSIGQGRLFIPN